MSMRSWPQKRLPRGITALLNHERFRAAYDFLLLRSEIGEVGHELAEWWTRIQEVDKAAQQEMIGSLSQNNIRISQRNAMPPY